LKLSIVIVSWNVRDDLAKCIRSIEENAPRDDFEVIVVDNASTDGTAEMVRSDFPGTTLIVNSANRGFAAANNIGIEKSRGLYVLLLNPDTIAHPGSLDALVGFMDDNEDVGVCGPKLLNEDGSTQPSTRRFPTLRGVLHCHTIFRFIPVFRGHYKKWFMKDFKYDRQRDVDQVMGAALMARRSIVEELGRMDEAFFMYYEEVDLCYRVKQAGWRIVFVPDAVITHSGGRSTDQVPVTKRIMTLRSLLIFLRKHRGRGVIAIFNIVFKPGAVLQDVYHLLMGILTIMYGVLVFKRRKLVGGARKVRRAAIFLVMYSWQILFKI